jgi:hypothetical protein
MSRQYAPPEADVSPSPGLLKDAIHGRLRPPSNVAFLMRL